MIGIKVEGPSQSAHLGYGKGVLWPLLKVGVLQGFDLLSSHAQLLRQGLQLHPLAQALPAEAFAKGNQPSDIY
nr:hypothetical protein [Synechococcus lacustris]